MRVSLFFFYICKNTQKKNQMKRTALLLISLVLIMSSCSIFKGGGSDKFEGVITYKISYPDSDLEPAQKAQLPKKVKTYVMGNKSKTVFNLGMAEMIQVVDGDNKSQTIMISGQGQKKYYTMNEEKINAQNTDINIKGIEKTDETKEIAGKTAKKVIIKHENEYGETVNRIVYYTPKVGSKALNFADPYMKTLDGLPLQYEEKQNNMTMKFTATSFEDKNLKETDFLVPDDYEELTEQEKKQMGL